MNTTKRLTLCMASGALLTTGALAADYPMPSARDYSLDTISVTYYDTYQQANIARDTYTYSHLNKNAQATGSWQQYAHDDIRWENLQSGAYIPWILDETIYQVSTNQSGLIYRTVHKLSWMENGVPQSDPDEISGTTTTWLAPPNSNLISTLSVYNEPPFTRITTIKSATHDWRYDATQIPAGQFTVIAKDAQGIQVESAEGGAHAPNQLASFFPSYNQDDTVASIAASQ